MSSDLRNICWPASHLGEALESLARRRDLLPKTVDAIRSPAWLPNASAEMLKDWVDAAAASLRIEALSVDSSYAGVESFLKSCSPAILRLELAGEQRFLAVLRRRGRALHILTPDLKISRIPIEVVRDALCDSLEAPLLPDIDRMLDEAGVNGRHRNRVRSSILRERLNDAQIEGCWVIRHRSSSSVWDQVREAGIRFRLVSFVGAHTAEYLLALVSWGILGRAALQGRIDHGWVIAWVLLLLTRIPLRLVAAWTQGLVAIRGAALMKRRLLAGSLRLEPEQVRNEGVGQLLGRVIESEALESLAVNGALSGLVSVIEIIVTAVIFAAVAGNAYLCVLLLVWTALLGLLALRYSGHRERWTEGRLDLTNELVERMAGHRTRLAQEPREQWHDAEDKDLDGYVHKARKLDQSLVPLTAAVPRGWMIVSLLVLAYDFVTGTATAGSLAVAFGGILLAHGALDRLTESLAYLFSASIAWRQVKPLWDAGAREELAGSTELRPFDERTSMTAGGETVLEVHDLVYRHADRADNVINGCTLHVRRGDRILLEGPSGGGKSTLASLLTGLRTPSSGLVALRGLDLKTLGMSAWRRGVASAPQFHENHIFSGTLAFNLLLARRWPPQPDDYEEAENICRELGLGDLLDRMPAGLLQTVGDTGWQLSYGERSRIFLARALLQRAELVVLDESFGALDPETLQQAINCARNRASTLMVIGHP